MPDYEQIIPKNHPVKLTLRTGATMTAIRQVMMARPDDTVGIRLSLASGRLTFEALDGKKIVGQAAMPVEYAGDPVSLAFAPEVFLDPLRVIGDDLFGFEMEGPGSPAVIRGPGNYTYVFMPTTA